MSQRDHTLHLISRSPEATEGFAEHLGSLLAAGEVIALDGDLGAGKTTFVRGLARGLGVTEDVSSPTFTLMNTYTGRVPVYHLDAWMAERGDAFLAEGGADWLAGDGAAVVEWAGKVEAWLPAGTLRLELAHGAEPETRHLRLRWEADSTLAERLAGLGSTPGTEPAPGDPPR